MNITVCDFYGPYKPLIQKCAPEKLNLIAVFIYIAIILLVAMVMIALVLCCKSSSKTKREGFNSFAKQPDGYTYEIKQEDNIV